MARGGRAMIRREAGEPKAALADARDASLATIASSFSHTPLEFGEAVECALAADAPDVIAELLARIDELQPVQLIPLLDAEATRARAHLAIAGRRHNRRCAVVQTRDRPVPRAVDAVLSGARAAAIRRSCSATRLTGRALPGRDERRPLRRLAPFPG